MYAIAPSDDADLLAGLIGRAFTPVVDRLGLTPETWRWHPSNYTPEKIRLAMAKGVRFHVLCSEGRPVGCVGIDMTEPGVCIMRRLAVLPDSQHRGFGRALVDCAFQRAAALGAERMEIGIFTEEAQLKDWYARLGFVVIDEGVQYDHLPLSVTHMAAPVRPADGARDGEST